MFDYDSYCKRLEVAQLDSDLDFPVKFTKFCDTIFTVEYLSGVVLAFDADFFIENSNFILCRPLLTVWAFKKRFEE